MPFCVQYDTATGKNLSTLNDIPADHLLPLGRAQLKFPDADFIETTGKIVDLNTLALIDGPSE